MLCYKEQDDAGNRTEDSVIAQELSLSWRGVATAYFLREKR